MKRCLHCTNHFSTNQPQAGFTLLEVLVVLFVISIAFGLVTLSVGGLRFDRVKHEIDALNAYLQVASEEAVLEGKVLGLRFEKKHEQFHYHWLLRFEDSSWQNYRSQMLDLTEFDESLALELELEGEPVDWDKKPVENLLTGEIELLPHIVFLPGGDQTPFKLTIEDTIGQQRWLLEGSSIGQVDIVYEAQSE